MASYSTRLKVSPRLVSFTSCKQKNYEKYLEVQATPTTAAEAEDNGEED